MKASVQLRAGVQAPAGLAAGASGAMGPLLEAVVLDTDSVLAELGTSPEGLSSGEARVRLARAGANLLPGARGPSLARQLLAEMSHFFAVMLWAAAGLAFVGGVPQLGVAIIAVIVFNGLFSFAQEYRAERAIRALSALLPATAVVRRDGRKATVPASGLVPGDIVLLREGDRISADARVLRSAGLKVDNSLLTGESEPVLRDDQVLERPPADLADATNLVFAGTFVASGSAVVVVAVTGARTRLGVISALTGAVVRRPTPLRLQLDRAVRLIAAFAVASGVVLFGVRCCWARSWARGSCSRSGSSSRWCPRGCCRRCRCRWP